ncbi:hypothetical protein [Pedobacter gandavensis]|uniref:hypothetical protein n=1 Tax=Pedobacter gandavensis TaxID=2679963 RepID=UPI002930E52F|nr:hypothetical protein [Pedobacter gandavensis]
MQIASLVLGLLSVIGMLIAFIPCFGSLNWLNIPFAVVGFIISIIAFTRTTLPGEDKGYSKAGLILCSVAIIFGFIRLTLGGGIL